MGVCRYLAGAALRGVRHPAGSRQPVQLLAAEPTPPEILVEGVQMHRWAERDGTYADLLARRSQSLAALHDR